MIQKKYSILEQCHLLSKPIEVLKLQE